MPIMTMTTDHPAPTSSRHWTGAPADSQWLAEATAMHGPLAAAAAAHDTAGDFTHDGFALARRHGLLAMLVPAEVGGGGATFAEACAALTELARACPSTALALSMHSHLVAAQVWRHHRGLPAPVLPRVASEGLVLVSTGASDWLGSNGTTVRVDGGYRVSARKGPASAAPAGNVLVTSVRWDDAPDGPQVIHATVPFSAPGVRVEPTWDALGMRATGSDTVVLDDVFVPEAAVALVRPADVWHPVWATVLGAALPLIMACYVGVADEAAARATAIAATRTARPGVASVVGRMGNRLTVARDAVAAMVAMNDDLRFDNTPVLADAVLTRKTIAAEAVTDTLRLALEVGGGAAYGRATAIERLFRDAHGALYHPLPAAQQERFSGRLALGLDPLG
jgi:alkylation response protein AidB-like acyl-CoA dehydrogenase